MASMPDMPFPYVHTLSLLARVGAETHVRHGEHPPKVKCLIATKKQFIFALSANTRLPPLQTPKLSPNQPGFRHVRKVEKKCEQPKNSPR